jgi:hypothetical protein
VASSRFSPASSFTRRRFLTAGVAGAAGLALYSGEIARHLIDTTHPEIALPNLPASFDGFRIVQVSDIHLEQYTEPFFLRATVEHINRLRPDAVFLTGDLVTHEFLPRSLSIHAAWKGARILGGLECKQRYAVLGNHDVIVNAPAIAEALTSSGMTVLRNSCTPLERGSGRIWLAGLDDCLEGRPNIEGALPDFLRERDDEPVLLLCHEPDYADTLLAHPAGRSVALMLSGHTHGGQIRIPLLKPVNLPDLGKKYVEGLFRLDNLQLYVNRGIGTVGVPFRLNCPPEITVITLRKA